MANLVIYGRPAETVVTLELDSAVAPAPASTTTANNRDDAHVLSLPAGLTPQGGVLTIAAPGYKNKYVRGLVEPEGRFVFDDFQDLEAEPVAPPDPEPPTPPASNDPEDIINGVYASGNYNLATHSGCGTFTEECCRQLAATWPAWGHVAKSPGQNQFNRHAVDAVMCLGGEYHGIWDIITSSVSSSAKPAFNRAGDSKPELWRPPAPLPCQPA